MNTTEIIKQALDLLYEKTELSGKEKNQQLIKKLGAISKGPEDGSVNYKKYIGTCLRISFSHCTEAKAID